MSMFTNEVVGPLTDAELRATPVPVATDGLTDAELRATPVPVSTDGLTDAQLRATPVPVSGPLTDSELRATPVPVSGTVSTSPVTSNSATVTQITSTGSNQTLLAANASRKKAIFYFNTGIWDLKYGVGASSTSRTLRVNSNQTLIEEMIWTGQVDVACTTSGKLVDVTEMV